MRWLLAILIILLALLQIQLWFGRNSLPDAWRLGRQAEQQHEENIELEERNATLEAEVQDLKQGSAAIEERARTELGMVKEGETFYQVVEPGPEVPDEPQSPADAEPPADED